MRWRRFSLLLGLCLWLFSCSESSVEQIPVQVPANVTVPDGMVYIPEGEFVYGHPDAPKTALGKKIRLPAYLIDRTELPRGDYSKFRSDYYVRPGKENFPVTHVTFEEAEAYCQSAGKSVV